MIEHAKRIADWLRAEGKAEGEARGEAKVLLRLLAQRFGTLPHAVRSRIRAGTIAELDRWVGRLLAAASLEDVFADP